MTKQHILAKILSMNNFNLFKSPGDVNQEIAMRMRQRRKEKKLTQIQLSERSDVSLGSLKRFERTGEISLSSLIKISYALGCEEDFDALFSKKGYTSIQEVIDEQL
ncbi:MAG: helix-turn-helix transcriptional regulator [Clostridiales bacterium]|nr:helix-turn-helix transcriptional regulator [Clostridiales bacterium]